LDVLLVIGVGVRGETPDVSAGVERFEGLGVGARVMVGVDVDDHGDGLPEADRTGKRSAVALLFDVTL
jgi:hypothetical protein